MNEIIEYRVPCKRYVQLIFVIGGATITLGVLIFMLLISAIKQPDFPFYMELIGYVFWFPICFMYSMWFAFGYEKAIIKDQTIELIKSNRIFSKSKCFLISDIQSIEVQEKKYKSYKWIDAQRNRMREFQRAFPFWIRMGQLNLVTKEGKYSFFNGLSNWRINEMKNKIEKQIELRKHNKAG